VLTVRPDERLIAFLVRVDEKVTAFLEPEGQLWLWQTKWERRRTLPKGAISAPLEVQVPLRCGDLRFTNQFVNRPRLWCWVWIFSRH
jgi:hypothetical protein